MAANLVFTVAMAALAYGFYRLWRDSMFNEWDVAWLTLMILACCLFAGGVAMLVTDLLSMASRALQ